MKKFSVLLWLLCATAFAQVPTQFAGLLTNATDYSSTWTSWYTSNGSSLPGTYSGPAFGTSQVDPIFGTTTTLPPAISDCGNDCSWGTSVDYSKVMPWSVDMKYFTVQDGQAWIFLYDATTTPYTFIRRIQISSATNTYGAGGGDLVTDEANWHWSRTAGTHLIYYTGCVPASDGSCAGRNALKAYNPDTDTSTLVHDFTPTIAAYAAAGCIAINNEREGEYSDNDNLFAFTCNTAEGDNSQVAAMVFNKSSNTVVSKAFTGAGNLCTYVTAGSTPGNCGSNSMNYITVSPSGKYILVNWNGGTCGHDYCWTAGGGTEVFDPNLNYLGGATGNNNHGDVGYDVAGNEVFVQQADQYWTDAQFHMVAVANLSACTSSTAVGPTTSGGCQHFFRLPSDYYIGNDTISMRATQGTGMGYALLSNYDNSTIDSPAGSLFSQENLALKIDWVNLSTDNISDQVTGSPNTYYRLGRTHSLDAVDDYSAQPDGVPNINFTAFAFSSTMDHANTVISSTMLPAGYDYYQAYYTLLPGSSSSPTQPAQPTQPTQTTSQVALATTASAILSGQAVTLTATTTTVGGIVPTGTVSFLNGSTQIGTGTLSSTGVATLSTTALPVGADSISISYAGDSNYTAGTSSSVLITVNIPPPVVGITVAQPEFGFNVIPGSTRRIFATVMNGSTNLVTWAVKSGSATLSSNAGSWIDVTAPSTGSSCSFVQAAGAWSVSSSTQFVVEATSSDDPTKIFDLTFSVCSPKVQLDVVPFYRTLYASQAADVQSIIKGSVNSNVHWAITSQPTGGNGSLTDTTARDAVFSATIPGEYVLTATSQADSTVSATATMYVTGNTMPYHVTKNITEPVDCTVDPAMLGTVYDVGPSQSFKTLASVPFPSMMAGSTVRLHNEDTTGLNPTTYHEYVQISQPSATAAQPIRICGVADSAGNLPVLDASGATGRSDDSTATAGSAILSVQSLAGTSVYPQYSGPGYIVVEGIKFQNAQAGNSYVTTSGGSGAWSGTSAAIRLYQVHHFVAVGNDIANNGMGTYSDFNAASGWGGSTLDVLWEGNHLHGNGSVGSSLSHQMNLQAWNEIVQFNRIESYPSGATGANLKSRSLGTIVRYNFFGDGAARQIDMAEVQDSTVYMTFSSYLNGYPNSFHDLNPTDAYTANLLAAAQEQWNSHFVYGNIYQNLSSYAPFHFAYDTVGAEAARKGNLYWYNNTFYEEACSSCGSQPLTLFDTLGANGVDVTQVEYPAVQAFNNILWMANPASPVFQWNNDTAFIGMAGTNLLTANWGTDNQAGGSGTGWTATPDSSAYQNASSLSAHLTGFTSSNLTTAGTMPFDSTTWILGSLVPGSEAVPSAVCEMPIRFAYLPSLGYAVPRVSNPNLGATDTVAETASTMTSVGGSSRYNTRNANCR
jgi:Bacterial Ig-like domain (group 3)